MKNENDFAEPKITGSKKFEDLKMMEEMETLKNEIAVLVAKDKAISTGDGYRDLTKDGGKTIQLEIAKKEEKIKLLEKKVLVSEKEDKMDKLKEEIRTLEKEYKDRITGVSGYWNKIKDKEEPIEAQILEKEAEIKAIETQVNEILKGNQNKKTSQDSNENAGLTHAGTVSLDHDKIFKTLAENKNDQIDNNEESYDSEGNKIASLENSPQFGIKQAEFPEEEFGSEGENITSLVNGRHHDEEKIERLTEIGTEGREVISDSENFKDEVRNEIVSEEVQPVFEQRITQEEVAVADKAIRERLAGNVEIAKRELDEARRIFNEIYAKKAEQYKIVLTGLGSRPRFDVLMAEDSEIASCREEYQRALQKYKDAFMENALYGLEGEKLERERIANEKYLEIMERDASFNARTQSRAEAIEPKQGWFARKYEEAGGFMKKNSKLLRNALIGGLVLGIGAFGASKLFDKHDDSQDEQTPKIVHTEKASNASNDNEDISDIQKELDQIKKETDDLKKGFEFKAPDKTVPQNQKVLGEVKEVAPSKNVALTNAQAEFARANNEYKEALKLAQESPRNGDSPSTEQTDAMQRADDARKDAAKEVMRLADAKALGMIEIGNTIRDIYKTTGYKWEDIKGLDYGNAYADAKLRPIIEKMNSDYKKEFKESFYPGNHLDDWLYRLKQKTTEKRLGIQIQ